LYYCADHPEGHLKAEFPKECEGNYYYSPGGIGYCRRFSFGCHKDEHPLNTGFDYYYGFNYSGSAFYHPVSMYENFELQKNVPGYLTDTLTDKAITFLEKSEQGKPFFLYLSYNAPHSPYDRAPEKYLKKFNTGNKNVDNYYAMINAVDVGIGRVVEYLKKTDRFKNTLIVFSPDNGAVGLSPLPRNGVYKGYKGMFHQGGTHIPMYMVWGDTFKQVGDYTKPVSNMDIMPTALAAAGCSIADPIDGVNLLPFFDDMSLVPHKWLYWTGPYNPQWTDGDKSFAHLTKGEGRRGLAAGAVLQWPYLAHFCPELGAPRVYDIEKDPQESDNLIQSKIEIVKEFRKMFDGWFKELPVPSKWAENDWKKLK